jgi:hypothetical protein
VLPTEILIKIFGSVPKKDHKNISLTNKAFHGVICEIEKFKFPLLIKVETVRDKFNLKFKHPGKELRPISPYQLSFILL